MFFNSITFLVFFGAVFLLFWLIPANQRRTRNLFILVTSYVFYGWWDWRFLSLIALSSAVDFVLGRAIHKETDEKRRKGLLGVSLAVNLGLLGVFKYFNFFVDSLDAALSMFGASAAGLHLEIVLPVGISFYTFQTLSYTIDVYRRQLKASQDLIVFAAYVSFSLSWWRVPSKGPRVCCHNCSAREG